MNEWVKAKDRLPNEEGRYLCNVDSPYHEVRLMDFHFKIKYVDKHCNKWTDTAGNPVKTSFVLYWMKLPEKPKVDTE